MTSFKTSTKKTFTGILLLVVTSLAFAFKSNRPDGDWLQQLRQAPFKIVLADGSVATAQQISFKRIWKGDLCSFELINRTAEPLSIQEVIVFDMQHGLPENTAIYGEGYTKLSQTGGTLAKPVDVAYREREHYKIPEPENLRTIYGMMMLQLSAGNRVLLASTSCNKFISRFSFDAKRLRISFDCENLQLEAGKKWGLEEFAAFTSADREQLYDKLTAAINIHHPKISKAPVPVGWCSWYCFGPRVTAQNVSDNTNWISKNLPALRYVQIDDGYQPWMGDWLEPGEAFNGGVKKVLDEIHDAKLEPAIWVAPFIASPKSKLFKEHPDWMVKDENGQPLLSNKLSFGGWRQGPWYMLDGTHPEVQKFFVELFKTMREKWHCTYFKLDANVWGALHGGVHYDKKATRIEAYRRGMEAIRKGAGDAFLLGCNHPLWPSLGLIHGSRSSGDVSRSWNKFKQIGRQNLLRGWQNGRLWWNDPDCVVLNGEGSVDIVDNAGKKTRSTVPIPLNEFLFHAATVYASGGMLLNGDDLTALPVDRLDILKKLIPPTGVAARFENENFEVGVMKLNGYDTYSVFNWGDAPVKRLVKLPEGKYELTDKWTGHKLGIFTKEYVINELAGRSALVIEARKTN